MNIHLVTNLTTFPFGTAAAKRIKMIARAVTGSGYGFSVYTNTLSYNEYDKAPKGVWDGVPFEYLHGTTALRIGKVKKLLLYGKGMLALNRILRKMNPASDLVYIYAHGNIFNVLTVLLCKRYRLKIVQEINEWDYEEIKAPFKKRIFHNTISRKSDGAIVISHNINNTVLAINPLLKTITIPVLEDPADYEEGVNNFAEPRYCFWMGLVNGYLDDVLLIVEACALAWKQGHPIHLIISGPCHQRSRAAIETLAREKGYPETCLRLTGYVSEEAVADYCKNAFFFIIPLWNNQKSLHRFPTKLASFLFSGKPVITSGIGEVGEVLTDHETALFFEPGNIESLAGKIAILFNDRSLYDKICVNTLQLAAEKFSYHAYQAPLKHFFVSVAGTS